MLFRPICLPILCSCRPPRPGDLSLLIQRSLDSGLHAPTEHVWNLTFERQLPKGAVLSLSYIGRMARSLLARRDVAGFNDLRDPQTGRGLVYGRHSARKITPAGRSDIRRTFAIARKCFAVLSEYDAYRFVSKLCGLLNDSEAGGITLRPELDQCSGRPCLSRYLRWLLYGQ